MNAMNHHRGSRDELIATRGTCALFFFLFLFLSGPFLSSAPSPTTSQIHPTILSPQRKPRDQMPATRSSAARRRAQMSDAPYSSAPPSSPPRLDSEVIIISSDDEHDPEPTPRPHPRTARKGKGRAFHVAEEDVIDVSDSSDKKTSGQSRGSHKPSRKAKETKEVRACAASRRAS